MLGLVIVVGIAAVAVFFALVGPRIAEEIDAARKTYIAPALELTGSRIAGEIDVVRKMYIAPPPDIAFPKLLDAKGTGADATGVFTTRGSEWKLVYEYDCANYGMAGHFRVELMNADGKPSDIAGIDTLGTRDKGTVQFHTGGSFYLTIRSRCQWHIQVYG